MDQRCCWQPHGLPLFWGHKASWLDGMQEPRHMSSGIMWRPLVALEGFACQVGAQGGWGEDVGLEECSFGSEGPDF